MTHLTASGFAARAHQWGDGGLAVRGALSAAAASVVLALMQSLWGTFLDGFGIDDWRIGVVATLLGLVDVMVLLGVLLFLFWGVARLTGAPRDGGVRTFVVVVTALLAAVLVEIAACSIELAATGEISERLVSDPARWLGAKALGALSLSNLAVYGVAAAGAVRYLGWSAPRAAALVLAVASLATASSAVV